jgi:hypothetical protein
VLCIEEMCGIVGNGSCMEEEQGDGGDDNEKLSPNQCGVLRKSFVGLSQ